MDSSLVVVGEVRRLYSNQGGKNMETAAAIPINNCTMPFSLS